MSELGSIESWLVSLPSDTEESSLQPTSDVDSVSDIVGITEVRALLAQPPRPLPVFRHLPSSATAQNATSPSRLSQASQPQPQRTQPVPPTQSASPPLPGSQPRPEPLSQWTQPVPLPTQPAPSTSMALSGPNGYWSPKGIELLVRSVHRHLPGSKRTNIEKKAAWARVLDDINQALAQHDLPRRSLQAIKEKWKQLKQERLAKLRRQAHGPSQLDEIVERILRVRDEMANKRRAEAAERARARIHHTPASRSMTTMSERRRAEQRAAAAAASTARANMPTTAQPDSEPSQDRPRKRGRDEVNETPLRTVQNDELEWRSLLARQREELRSLVAEWRSSISADLETIKSDIQDLKKCMEALLEACSKLQSALPALSAMSAALANLRTDRPETTSAPQSGSSAAPSTAMQAPRITSSDTSRSRSVAPTTH